MNKIILTAIREFKATALTPAFLFGAVIPPVVIWGVLGAAGAAGLFSQQPEPTKGTIALVDPTPDDALTELVAVRLDPVTQKAKIDAMNAEAQERISQAFGTVGENAASQAGNFLRIEPSEINVESLDTSVDLEPVRQRVRDGELLALIEVTETTFEPGGTFTSQVGEKAKARDIDLIEDAVADSVVDVRLTDAGMSAPLVRTLYRRPGAEQKTLKTAGGETTGSEMVQRFLPIAFLVFLAIAIAAPSVGGFVADRRRLAGRQSRGRRFARSLLIVASRSLMPCKGCSPRRPRQRLLRPEDLQPATRTSPSALFEARTLSRIA